MGRSKFRDRASSSSAENTLMRFGFHAERSRAEKLAPDSFAPVKAGETTSHADLMCFGSRLVDPGHCRQLRWQGPAVPEPGGVGGVGGAEGAGPLRSDLGGGAEVDRRRSVQPDAGVAVHVVVVIEEHRAERPSVFDGAEPAGERRAVLEGLEVRLAVGVVVADMGAAVAAGDAEVDKELGDGLGGHRGPPVGVQGELVRSMPWRASASAMNASASSPVSAGDTIQATT